MTKQRGFTLTELMLAVAITGILAGIAVPSYSDYVIRTKVSTVMATMAAIRPMLLSEYQVNGVMPPSPSDFGSRMEDMLLASEYIDNVEYVRNGKSPLFAMFHVRLTNLGAGLDGKLWSFYFRPDDLDAEKPVQMQCFKHHLPERYIPQPCR